MHVGKASRQHSEVQLSTPLAVSAAPRCRVSLEWHLDTPTLNLAVWYFPLLTLSESQE